LPVDDTFEISVRKEGVDFDMPDVNEAWTNTYAPVNNLLTNLIRD